VVLEWSHHTWHRKRDRTVTKAILNINEELEVIELEQNKGNIGDII